MKQLNKNSIIKNQVNTIEQYKVLNYLKDTFNITKDETKNLNKYGLLKLNYLKKNNKVLYQRLIIEDKLNTFLFSVGKEAEEKVKFLINELVEKDKDLNESLKEKNQLLWVQKMNNYKNIAEEIVLKELIFNEKE